MSTWLFVAMLFASVADLASSEYCLAQGCTEQNVFMENRAVRIASNLAVPVAVYLILRNRDPWIGRTFAAVHIGFKLYFTGNNIYVGAKVCW